MAGAAPHRAHVDALARQRRHQRLALGIGAERAGQRHLAAEPCQVGGDVVGDPARGLRNAHGIGAAGHEFALAARNTIDVGRTDTNDPAGGRNAYGFHDAGGKKRFS